MSWNFKPAKSQSISLVTAELAILPPGWIVHIASFWFISQISLVFHATTILHFNGHNSKYKHEKPYIRQKYKKTVISFLFICLKLFSHNIGYQKPFLISLNICETNIFVSVTQAEVRWKLCGNMMLRLTLPWAF